LLGLFEHQCRSTGHSLLPACGLTPQVAGFQDMRIGKLEMHGSPLETRMVTRSFCALRSFLGRQDLRAEVVLQAGARRRPGDSVFGSVGLVVCEQS